MLSECAEFDKDFDGLDPKELSDFGVDVRYPGDLYVPGKDETLEYKSLAIEIGTLVKRKIKETLESNKY